MSDVCSHEVCRCPCHDTESGFKMQHIAPCCQGSCPKCQQPKAFGSKKEEETGEIEAIEKISDGTSDSMLVINREVRKLKENGWLAPHPSADKDYWLEMLEPESVGVHSGYCDEEGSYWVVDQVDCWPSDPMLVRRVGKKQLAVFEGDDNEESG